MESVKISSKQKLQEVRKKLANLTEAELTMLKSKTAIITVEGHHLSPTNRMMCYIQAEPMGITPTIVGGYRQWQAAGKQVKKGEHGFSIMFPSGIKKSEDGAVNDDNLYFLAATVFDISQVEVKENKPISGVTYQLTGKSGDKCISNGNTWAESATAAT